MSAQKKMLSLEELEAQTLVELPDRELMHAGKHSSSNTTVIACSQNNSHSGNALLLIGTLFVPVNLNLLACNNVAF
jgi:hypothetical protein